MKKPVVTQCLVQARRTKEGITYVLSEARYDAESDEIAKDARFVVLAIGNLRKCAEVLIDRAVNAQFGVVNHHKTTPTSAAECKNAWLKAFRDVRHINQEDYWNAREDSPLPVPRTLIGWASPRGKFDLNKLERYPKADWKPDTEYTILMPHIGMARYDFMPGWFHYFTREANGGYSHNGVYSPLSGDYPYLALKRATEGMKQDGTTDLMEAFALVSDLMHELPRRMREESVEIPPDTVIEIDHRKVDDPHSTKVLGMIDKAFTGPITFEEIGRRGELDDGRGWSFDIADELFKRVARMPVAPGQGVEPVVVRPPTDEERKQIESRRKRRESGPEPFSVSAKADARIRPVALV